ncbi:MAG: arginine--tRNA ligase, partial [Candidatus Eremiobacteraeota bacterium]|nr:arginine--tRNA ligase [Candidatus Eremiobacteraeota bacterium]
MRPTTTEEPRVLPDDALRAFGAAANAAIATLFPDAPPPEVAFEAPRRPEFGDFSTNVAFSLTKIARRSPQDVATALAGEIHHAAPETWRLFSSVEPVAGFINVRLAPSVWHAVVEHIVGNAGEFGASPSNGRRISLEFGSANPTGPLVVVQGRSMSVGDTLARSMRFCGYDVFVEWIINDAGGQLDDFGRSLYARYRQLFDASYPFPEGGYPGEYVIALARAIRDSDGERWIESEPDAWLPYFSKFGRDELVAQQRRTAERFGVTYDLWQSEKELHETGKIREGIDRLKQLGHTYEKDGALFFAATEFGDDKDRVLVRSDGRPTYFAMDVAYHYQKMQRRERVIDILGPDHHGYIGRLKGLAKAYEFDPDAMHVLIAQQIALTRGQERVSMSKRAGEIVTLDDILDEVGVDAARFFFIMPGVESPLTFDLQLAVEKDAENPVYYVQYGHARIASVLRNAAEDDVA